MLPKSKSSPSGGSEPIPPSVTTRGSLYWGLIWLPVAVAASFVLYHKVIGFPFSPLDDVEYVIENPAIRSLSWVNLRENLFVSFVANFAPIHILAYALEYHIWGLWAPGYHAVNIALHGVNAYLVAVVCLRLGLSRAVSVLTGTIFLVHPVQAESVVWISELKTLLAAAFFLGCLSCYIRAIHKPSWVSYLTSILLFCAAVFSKVSVVALPLLLLAYHRAVRRDAWRNTVLRIMPFLVLSLFSSALAVVTQSSGKWGIFTWEGRLASVWSMTGAIGTEYLQHLLFPMNLSPYYYIVPEEASAVWNIAGAIVVLAGVAVSIRALVFRRIEGFLLGWSFIMILPNSNLLPLDVLLADRYLYVPSIGIFALASTGIVILRNAPISRSRATIFGLLVAIMIGALATRTFQESLKWKDSITLYGSIVRNNPSPRIMVVLAEVTPASDSRGESESREAIAGRTIDAIHRELVWSPDNPQLYQFLARAYHVAGKPEESKLALFKALEIDPNSTWTLERLAALYIRSGKNYSAALPLIERALSLSPNRINPLFLYTQIQSGLGHYQAASRAAQEMIRLWPHEPTGVMVLADILRDSGDSVSAITLYRRVIEMSPASGIAKRAAANIRALGGSP
jgi:protein O-mannosyl-transferase